MQAERVVAGGLAADPTVAISALGRSRKQGASPENMGSSQESPRFPSNGCFEGDIHMDLDVGVDVEMIGILPV